MIHPDDREKAAIFKNAAIAGVAPPPVILSDLVFASVTPGVSERGISAARIRRRPSAEGRPHGAG